VQVPSQTGDELAALERLGELATAYGLSAQLHRYDLEAVRASPGYPGEVAPRENLLGLTATLRGTDRDAPRICLNGHIDVVAPGLRPWSHSPWAGVVAGGRLYGRGSVDMKGGLAAALHAIAAVAAAGGAPGEIVLQAVSSEEDGGAGTFAELLRDDRYDGCVIPEPTGLDVVCAHGGSQQFEGTVYGRSTHAAIRLEGLSAIDRYLPLHAAMAEHERLINSNVEHELMRRLELPYPINVGRLEAGQWPAQVPDRLRFAGRLGIPIGVPPEQARQRFEASLADALDGAGPPLELRWTGGFRPSTTALDDALVSLCRDALSVELDRPARLAGVPWGADMQHFCARGIPCVMLGTTGIERAHAVDEYVELAELVAVARALVRVVCRFSANGGSGR
jgi:acetylornithine deacetylase